MADSKCNSTTPLVPVPPKSMIFLHEWWLVKQSKGLTVGGVASVERDRERVFMSSMIAEREEVNVLHSEDGITILFRGSINTSRSCQNGVPLEVCQHFQFGFPHDWKKYSDIKGFGDSNKKQGISFEQSEPIDNNTSILNSSQQYNGEKGQALLGVNDSGKPPISAKTINSDRREKQRNNASSRRSVTRDISKRSHKMLKDDEKVPLRRSPRLSSR